MKKNLIVAIIISVLFWPSHHIVGLGDTLGIPQIKPPVQKTIKDTSLSNVELAVAVETPKPVVVPVINTVDCGSDPYMAQIYSHESGCSTTRTNSIGCVGLGQACPGSKLYAVCPTLDWNCENNFFTNYANSRYGSPAQAWAVWQVQRWW